MTPISRSPRITAASGARQPGHDGGDLDDGVVGVHDRQLGASWEEVADRLATQRLGHLIGHRLVEHSGQRRIVLDIAGHQEPDHLRGRQDRARPISIGHHQPRQSMLRRDRAASKASESMRQDWVVLGHLLGMHTRRVRRIGCGEAGATGLPSIDSGAQPDGVGLCRPDFPARRPHDVGKTAQGSTWSRGCGCRRGHCRVVRPPRCGGRPDYGPSAPRSLPWRPRLIPPGRRS